MIAGALALCLIAACGQLPRPFQHEGPPSELLSLQAPSGIYVEPLTGDQPTAAGATASQAMADALHLLDIPASTRTRNESSLTLHGHAKLTAQSDADSLSVVWELRDAKGSIVGIHHTKGQLPPGLWSGGSPEVMTELAREAAPKIAAMIQDPVDIVDVPQTTNPVDLAILPLIGTFDDPDDYLRQALSEELRNAGFPVVQVGTDEVLMIQGTVTLEPGQADQELMTLVWSLRQAEDGTELGKIEQQSLVPQAALRENWVQTARDISKGAAIGIEQVIEQVDLPL